MKKTVFTLAYFPTNPLRVHVPDAYKFLSLSDSEVAFGTLVKSKDDTGYLLRIYNNENKPVEGGKLNVHFTDAKLFKTNLIESEYEETTHELGVLKPGELRTIKIEKA